ncbi:amino acid adenylation domain-containing protein [Kitasatospora xanthocidica]|uniref:amino acid adenylation domain-containing protein n=1 Tax=Kitasatospora xanthocidica TaxID=83382 RepID=UPI0036EA8D67
MDPDSVHADSAHSPASVAAAAVRAWEAALGTSGLSADADFFEQGGDSMGGARLMGALRAEFGQGLPLTLLFLHPVLADFTEALTEAVRELGTAEPRAGAVRETVAAVPRAAEPDAYPVELPLSAQQEAQWVAEQVAPGNLAYTELLALRLTGPLDPDRLQRVLDRLVARHEALRTGFPVGPDGIPVQRIGEPSAGLALVRLEAPDEEAARRLALADLDEPFDLAAGPLVRARLVRLGDADHVLLLSAHHIVLDGPSMEVLLAELTELYAGRELPEPAPSYAAYTREQGKVDLDGQLDHWREALAGAVPVGPPPDRPRPAVRGTDGRRLRFAVPGAVRDRLDALARAERTTRFTVLMAAFQLLLGRWAGSEDVVVGSPVSSRSRVELESMVGALVNMAAFRGDLSGDPAFRELLGRTREAAFGAVTHSDVPFSRVLAELAPERDGDRPPLFSTTLVLQPTPPVHSADLGEVGAVSFPVPRHHAMYDFSLYAWEAPDELLVDLEYATALFDEASVRRFADRFTALLAAVAQAPDRPLSELDALPQAERRQVLYGWNDTRADLGPDVCVHEVIAEQARATPGRIAVTGADRTLSYAELDAEADELADRLRALGAGPERVVAVSLSRSVRLLVTLLAVWKSGAAYLPLDPAYPRERREFMTADAGALLLVDESGIHPCGGSAPSGAGARPTPGNLAYVLYTSGSTGEPKGVMVTHRAVLNRLRWMSRDCGLGPDDVLLQNAVHTFDYAVWELFGPLHLGATVVLPGPDGHRDLAELVGLIVEHGVTVAHFVPSMLRHFLDEPGAERCTGLRVLFSGGEPLDVPLARRVGELLPGVRLFNAYGPTEAAVDVTCWPVPERPGTVAIGGPAANTACYVLDERMRPLPVGAPGELHLGGVQLARGYRGRAALTAERFVPDPFGPPGGRLYRTGDRVRWRSDGTLEYLDRIDRQLKIRGFRVEPGEIEAALLAHPDVREAAVADAEDGRGGRRLVAYHSGGPAGGAEALREHLALRLPEFAVPSVFVELPGGLPLLPSGKLDRHALPAPGAGTPKATAAGVDEAGYAPPLGPRELMLAALWSEVLGVDRIGREDSFFQLGGDSILGIQMVAKARRAGIGIRVPDLFRYRTLAALAKAAGAVPGTDSPGTAAAAPAPAPRAASTPEPGPHDPFPLTPLQREMLRKAAAAPGRGVYVVPAESLLSGEIDPQALRTAFRRLVERHPVLRTSVDGGRQQAHPAAEPSFRHEDWSALPAEEQERRRAALLEEEWRTGFPAGATQLSRIVLVRLGERRSSLVWTRHNALLDGWSFAQLYDELLELHAALRDGHPEPPPAEPREPFAAHVARLAGRQGPAAETLWREQLHDLAPRWVFAPEPGPSEQPYRELRLPLPQDVEAFAQQRGFTLSNLLEAAWAAVLARRTGTTDVQYGLVFSTREAEDAGAERMLGLMVNNLPSGQRLDRGAKVADWLRLLHQRGAELKELAAADPEALRERLGGPLFDTLLLIHNYPHNFDNALPGGLRMIDTQGFSRTGAALTVSVDPKPLRLAMLYDAARADEATVRQLGLDLAEVLSRITADPDRAVGELLA